MSNGQATQSYLLREIPAPLWARVKARADLDRLPLRSLLLLLAEGYANGQITIGGVQQQPITTEATPPRRRTTTTKGAK